MNFKERPNDPVSPAPLDPDNLPEGVRRISEEEGYVHILRGLISYHERMTMGDCGRDIYLDALRFALTCVEEKIQK